MTSKDERYCRGCVHFGHTSGIAVCNYSYDMGHCRSLICKPGVGCVCRTTDKKYYRGAETVFISPPTWLGKKPHYAKIDDEKAKKLYEEGKTDPEIARHFNCRREAVRLWRMRNLLPSKHKGGRPKKESIDDEKGSLGTAV